MKKIATILVAIALIAMMGTAAAADVDLMIGIAPNNIVINPDGIAVSTTDVLVKSIDYPAEGTPHTRILTVMTDAPGLQVRVHNVDYSNDTGWTSMTPADFLYKATGGDYQFIVEVKGTTVGAITIVDNAGIVMQTTPPGGNDVMTASASVDIPEFPTVALPIAAILGLAFIFQRRREED